ncbi:MAG: type II toxin-antitoxin system RelE/ParE family toxin [Oceanicaulis sp.]
MKPVRYSKQALRTLTRMPANDARRIRAKMAQYAEAPQSLAANVKALKGDTALRLRVGDWRIIFDDGVVIAVLRIAPRGSAYE